MMSLKQDRNSSSKDNNSKNNSSEVEVSESSLDIAGDKVEEMEEAIQDAIEEHVAVKEKLEETDRNIFSSIASKLTGKREAMEIEKTLDETRNKFEETMKPYNDEAEEKIREACKSVIEADPNLKIYIKKMKNTDLEEAINGTGIMTDYVHDRQIVLNQENLNLNPVTMMYCRKISRGRETLKEFRKVENKVDQKLVEAESKIEAGEDPEKVAKNIFGLLGSDLGISKVERQFRQMKNIEIEDPSNTSLKTGF